MNCQAFPIYLHVTQNVHHSYMCAPDYTEMPSGGSSWVTRFRVMQRSHWRTQKEHVPERKPTCIQFELLFRIHSAERAQRHASLQACHILQPGFAEYQIACMLRPPTCSIHMAMETASTHELVNQHSQATHFPVTLNNDVRQFNSGVTTYNTLCPWTGLFHVIAT